jgi:excisionase family DNA binding protein
MVDPETPFFPQSERSSQGRRRVSDGKPVNEPQAATGDQAPTTGAASSGGNGRGYLRAAEAAALLHVSPKTISRWAREGKLGHVVTLGGHRRFSRSDIEALAERMVMTEEG